MKTKLNIAQITPYYYPSIGGVSAVAQYISEELVNRGHKVDAITAFKDHKGRPPLNVPFNEVINGVNVFRYRSILNISHMSVMPGLITHLIKHKYDVLHYHSYRHPLCDISASFGKIKKCVNVLHGHGPFFERGEIGKLKHLIYDIYDKVAQKTTLKWTDSIITLNKFEYSNFKDIFSDDDKLVIIPNAAESNSFIQTDPSDFIKKYNLIGKKIILCLGILNESKRQDLLIEALPKIVKEVPEAFLILVGPDGNLLEKIKATAKSYDVERYYKFIGPLMGAEKHMAFDSASIFALVSDKDAYPLVIAEAMAHHLPVIATDARGPKDMIHNGIDGLIVKKRNVSEISSAIIKLLKNDTLRKEMSLNARLNAEKNHSQTGVVDQLEKIYYDLLNKKSLQRV
jgi:glycosyltransferase involved in cell wall biosynthesis